jgi:site-specific DNA-methyltransferase (adenine-specific)
MTPLSSIHQSPGRQRQFFDPIKLADLQSSIERIGLLQPLLVTHNGTLVAGERRLKAIEALHALGIPFTFQGEIVPPGTAPTILFGGLSAGDLFQAELDENTIRANLTWQEEAEAVRRLHTIREGEAAIECVSHSIADTAKELHGRSDGGFQDTVRKQVIVAKHLTKPEVAKAKSVDEAFKILRKQEQTAANKARGAEISQIPVGDRHTLLKGDCITLLEELPDESFDLIITDPPYGIGANSFGTAGGKQLDAHSYEDSYASFKALLESFAGQAYRVAKPKAHLYLWCDIDNFPFIRSLLRQHNWTVHRTPIVYHKPDGNRIPWVAVGLQRKWELILFACKGYRPLNTVVGDIFACTGDDNLGHGAQKPVAAYAELLRRSASPGDTVLDAFAGSGPLLPAAHAAGCQATLIEQDDAAFGIILGRLEELK